MRPWQEAENVPTISQDSCLTTCNITKINGIFGETIQNILLKKGYKLGKTIGEGSYCKVKIAYRASELGFVEKIACKIVNKKKASRDFVTKFLPREVSIVRSIRHPNIVSVCDIIESEDLVYIFMDICERGDLLDYIRARGPLSEARTKFFFRQMVEAISYLHSRDIAHRDLKCENVLLAGRDHLKIADFGFARWCSDTATKKRILSETYCGSAAYAAPEILQGVKYNPKMYDIWSLGVILFIMISAAMPFDDSNISRLIKAQMNKKFSFPEKICVSSKVKRLVSMLCLLLIYICEEILIAMEKVAREECIALGMRILSAGCFYTAGNVGVKLINDESRRAVVITALIPTHNHLLEPDVTKRATIKQVANYAWLDDRCYSGSLLRI